MIGYCLLVLFSIMIHEAGHLIISLLFNVKVYAYSIGFGKVLFHKTFKGIDYRISLIPLGGYCKIEEAIEKPNSIINLPYYKQFIILVSGVAVNFLCACICYLIQFHSIKIGIMVDLIVLKACIFQQIPTVVPLLLKLNVNIWLLQLSMLNLALAITNLCPIAPLDGGLLFLFPLKKRIPKKWYNLIYATGFVLVIWIQILFVMYCWK